MMNMCFNFLGKLYNFDIADPSIVDMLGIPYDYGSMMHYSTHSYSKNGLPTIVPKDPSWIPYLGKTFMPSELVSKN